MSADFIHPGIEVSSPCFTISGMQTRYLKPEPKLLALCGAPKAGKTTVAEFLAERYGVVLVDDGMVLREACHALFGGRLTDYTTQAGKAQSKTFCGKTLTNRELCGQLGNHLEAWFGDQIIPELTLQKIENKITTRAAPGFVFPSVRKTQGITYHKHGGIVIEVVRPGFEPVHDFDHYDKSLVNYIINNDGSRGQLLGQIIDLAEGSLGLVPLKPEL